jgi:hypothetical protein
MGFINCYSLSVILVVVGLVYLNIWSMGTQNDNKIFIYKKCYKKYCSVNNIRMCSLYLLEKPTMKDNCA